MGKAAVRSSGKKGIQTEQQLTFWTFLTGPTTINVYLFHFSPIGRAFFYQLLSLLFYMLSYFNVSSLY